METIEKFQVCEKLGEGTYGKIFRVRHPETSQEFAMKVEDPNKNLRRLAQEAYFYAQLTVDPQKASECGVPMVYNSGEGRGFNYMLMDLMGPSIEELFRRCSYSFSLKTVLMICVQLLSSIKFIHSKGILHRDIKPQNFVIGLKNVSHKVFMIDLGLSKAYIQNGQMLPFRNDKIMAGTVRYASINNQQGIEQSRRDDMETLAYNFIYLMRGNLPWQEVFGKNKQEKYDKILVKKLSKDIEDICKGMPQIFGAFLKYTRGLEYEEEPDYDFWIHEFYEELTTRQNFAFDYEYDWKFVFPVPYATPHYQLPEDVKSNAYKNRPAFSTPEDKVELHADFVTDFDMLDLEDEKAMNYDALKALLGGVQSKGTEETQPVNNKTYLQRRQRRTRQVKQSTQKKTKTQ